MRLFDNLIKEEHSNNCVFNKEQIIKEILEKKSKDCPGWYFFKLSEFPTASFDFDKMNCDFVAIYTDVINKEITSKENPFSHYKRTVESVYQIVREIHIIEKDTDINCESDQFYKKIIASSSKELFIKLKNEI